MRRLLFLIMLIFILSAPRVVQAQNYTRVVSLKEVPPDSIDPANPAFRAKFEDLKFGDQFSLAALTDPDKTYYIVDFTKLNSHFEKVWFMNLVFAQDKVVNIDSNIGSDRVWFMASNRYTQKDVQDIFLALKKQTQEQSASMSPGEQAKWLETHDKYK